MSDPHAGQPDLAAPPASSGAIRRQIVFALVLIVCIALRIWLVRHTTVIARDGVTYIQMARQWQVDPGETMRTGTYHPGYPAAVATVYGLVGDATDPDTPRRWEHAGQLVSLISGLVATACVWMLTGLVFNWRAAPVAAVLFGCGAKWAALGVDVTSDALSVCLQMMAILAALWALHHLRARQRRSLIPAALVGLFAGAGYLVRGEAVIVAGVAGVLWLGYALARRVKWRHAIAATATAATVCLLCMLPYMTAIGGLTRKHVLGTSIAASPGGLPPLARPEGRHAALMLVGQLSEAMHPICGFLVLVWLIAWCLSWRKGVSARLARPQPAGPVVTLTAAAVSIPVLLIHYRTTGFMSHRYLMLLAALLAPTAGVAVCLLANLAAHVLQRLGGSAATRRGGAVTVITLALLAGLIVHAAKPLHEGGKPRQAAGYLLRDLAGADGVVVADSAWVRHYAGDAVRLRGRRLTAGDLTDALRSTDRSHVYLALTTIARQRDPNMGQLLQSAAFDLIAWPPAADQPDGGLRLYRVTIDALPSGE